MATALAAGIDWIDLRGVNAFLVTDGETVTLVDTGFPWQAGAIRAAIDDVGQGLDRILLTHVDLDHVGGLNRLADGDVPVVVGAADAEVFTKTRRPPLTNRKGLFQRATDWWRAPPAGPVHRVEDGDAVGPFTAYHTPGHTPGHTAFVSEALSVGLLGDLVRERNGRLRPAPWLLNYDTAAVRSSIRHLVDRAPAFEIACVGHGTPIVTGGADRLAASIEAP